MDQRQSLINLAFTVGIVAAVAAGSLVFRNRHPHTVSVTRSTPAVTGPVAPPLPGGPVQRPVEKTFQSYPKGQLIDSPANEAETLRLKVPEGEYVFVHYFVDALDATAEHSAHVDEQRRYFKAASNDVIIETGKEAMAYVADLLKKRPFIVLTRWERVPNMDRYYALIWVEFEPGQWRYLSELLVRQGYARVSGLSTPLPGTKETEDDYLQVLGRATKFARQKKLGIWAKVKG